MAYAMSRSMNGELIEGMTDGSHRKNIPSHSMMFENDANTERYRTLDETHYGNMHARSRVRLPDGTVAEVPSQVLDGMHSY